jgi:hypothetical protein
MSSTVKTKLSKQMPASSTSPSHTRSDTSINIFRDFLIKSPTGAIDASQIVSSKCYQAWLSARKTASNTPEKAFQRALSGHVCGVDGRVPFNQDEEEAILKVLRRKLRWECFTHCSCKFGEAGFKSKGFHEKALAGEIQKTKPKKRSKKAIERLKKIVSLPPITSSGQRQAVKHARATTITLAPSAVARESSSSGFNTDNASIIRSTGARESSNTTWGETNKPQSFSQMSGQTIISSNSSKRQHLLRFDSTASTDHDSDYTEISRLLDDIVGLDAVALAAEEQARSHFLLERNDAAKVRAQ